MATLVKPAVRFASYLLSSATVLWLVTMFCDRLYALHTTYREECLRRSEEEWLRTNCRDPVFFTNLRGHTDVCDQVERNAMRNLALFSLRHVMQHTYVCGTESCSDLAVAALAHFLHLSTPLMALVAVMAVLCPLVLVQLVRVFTEAFRPAHHRGAAFYPIPVEPRLGDAPRYPPYHLTWEDDGARKRV